MKKFITCPSVLVSRKSLIHGLAAALLAVGLSSVAVAQTQIAQPFDGESLPTDWFAHYNQAANQPAAGALGIEDAGNGSRMLRLERASSAGSAANLTYYYTGSQGSIANGVLGNFTSSMTVRPTVVGSANFTALSSNWQGVVVGAQSLTYSDPGGFYVAYNRTSLSIYSSPANHIMVPAPPAAPITPLSTADFATALSANTDYKLYIAVEGDTLLASMWTNDGLTQLASVSWTASGDISGYFGLRSSFGNGTGAAYFGGLELNAYPPIPEPAATALLLIGLIAGGALALRRRRR